MRAKGYSSFSFCAVWHVSCHHSPFINLGGFCSLGIAVEVTPTAILHNDLDRLSGWQAWNHLDISRLQSLQNNHLGGNVRSAQWVLTFQIILQHYRQTKDMERNGHFLQGWKTLGVQVPHSSRIHFTTSLFLKSPFSVLGQPCDQALWIMLKLNLLNFKQWSPFW